MAAVKFPSDVLSDLADALFPGKQMVSFSLHANLEEAVRIEATFLMDDEQHDELMRVVRKYKLHAKEAA